MKFVVSGGGRSSGKTIELIHCSEQTGHAIMVRTQKRADDLKRIADSLGVVLPEPVIMDPVLVEHIEAIEEQAHKDAQLWERRYMGKWVGGVDFAEGDILQLPCKLGSTVYIIGGPKYRAGSNEYWINTGKFKPSDLEKWGITVFGSETDAEAKLRLIAEQDSRFRRV